MFFYQINYENFAATWRGNAVARTRSVINDLVEQGKVKQYLKPYATRHTFITAHVNAGNLSSRDSCLGRQ